MVGLDLVEILQAEVRRAGAPGSLLHDQPLGGHKGHTAGEGASPVCPNVVPGAPGTCPPARRARWPFPLPEPSIRPPCLAPS